MSDFPRRNRWFQARLTTWILLGFLAVGGFFLVTEHTVHLLGFLPFAIFLLCPLMMLFMHHGHGDQLVHDDQDNLARHDDTTSPVGQAVSHDHSEERTQRVAAKEFQPQEETREGER